MSSFSAISWRGQVTFNEMMMMSPFVLNQRAKFDLSSANRLKQPMSLHSDTLS